MGYNLINWENSPSKQTPINAENLNQMDVNIAKAIQGTRFNFSATFTSDGVLKNATSTEALDSGSFATGQTDIVTAFVADNVTKISNGTFSNCTSLKTIYIDNTVGNIDIVSGAVPSGVSIVYSNAEKFINVNELLASAIKSLKSLINANKTDWENRATSIETQHKTDVTELSQTIQKVKESALEEFASVKADVSTNEKSIESLKADFNKSVDVINTTLDTKENVSNKVSVITHPSIDYYPDTKAVFDYVNSKLETPLADIESLKADKLDKTDFNSYKSATDTDISKCVTDIANNSALINQNAIKNTTDKSTSIVLNDSSDCSIVDIVVYGNSTQSAVPSPTNPVEIVSVENPILTFSNDTDSQNVTTECTLRGINNICDTLTVNSDGTGYITQRLVYERLKSGKSSSYHTWQYSSTSGRFYRDDSRFKANFGTPILMCNYFESKNNENDKTLNNTIGFTSGSGSGVAIRMNKFDGDISTFENWLDENQVYVLVPLKKPVIVNLSKSEIDKILALHTYYPSTTVISDSDFEMTYISDTKNYIDSKFNELAQVIVASADESEVM